MHTKCSSENLVKLKLERRREDDNIKVNLKEVECEDGTELNRLMT
jgi:hypothetical protein